jgi:enamine deaminase RidA (YjgF/YER057c/UK114 family)
MSATAATSAAANPHLPKIAIEISPPRRPLQRNIEAPPASRNRARDMHARSLRGDARSAKTSAADGSGGYRRRSKETSMAGTVEKKLAELGIILPTPASPVANYIPFVRAGALLFVSGQICLGADGKLVAKGKLGAEVSLEDGQKAARACAVNVLAQVKAAIGDLDKVKQVVRLGGFINSAPTFLDGPKVMNGASDLMVAVLGDKGRHARSTVGVAVLPGDAAVEVEGVFEVA